MNRRQEIAEMTDKIAYYKQVCRNYCKHLDEVTIRDARAYAKKFTKRTGDKRADKIAYYERLTGIYCDFLEDDVVKQCRDNALLTYDKSGKSPARALAEAAIEEFRNDLYG